MWPWNFLIYFYQWVNFFLVKFPFLKILMKCYVGTYLPANLLACRSCRWGSFFIEKLLCLNKNPFYLTVVYFWFVSLFLFSHELAFLSPTVESNDTPVGRCGVCPLAFLHFPPFKERECKSLPRCLRMLFISAFPICYLDQFSNSRWTSGFTLTAAKILL